MFVHNKKRPLLKIIIGVFLGIILIFVLAAGFAYTKYTSLLKAPGMSDATVQLVVQPGQSTASIATSLKAASIIQSEYAFKLYIRINGDSGKLKAGTYDLRANWSVAQVVDAMILGHEKASNYTIAPGLRVDQIKKRKVKAGFAQGDVDTAFSASLYRDIAVVSTLPQGVDSLEGYIFPDTYSISPTTRPTDIVRMAVSQMDVVVSTSVIAKFKADGLTPYQAITLASVIEKEVSGTSDRKKVAQIFLSRIKLGIPLGSDATYYYASAMFGGEPFPDLDSPYNTRKYSGLPPGPIGNVSVSALNAVAAPENSDYLFFVTGDDGVNHFTSTDAEHNAAVTQYCKISCATGYLPTIE